MVFFFALFVVISIVCRTKPGCARQTVGEQLCLLAPDSKVLCNPRIAAIRGFVTRQRIYV